MGVIVKCKQQKKTKQYSGNLTACQRQQRASFSKTRAMLTVQLSIIKENIVVFKKRNNVIYVKHGGPICTPSFQEYMISSMERYCNVHLH